MAVETFRTELQDPERGRWTRVELQVDDGVVLAASAESAALPLLAETVSEVVSLARGRTVDGIRDMSPEQAMRTLPPSTTRRADDVAFALRALQQALAGRTH